MKFSSGRLSLVSPKLQQASAYYLVLAATLVPSISQWNLMIRIFGLPYSVLEDLSFTDLYTWYLGPSGKGRDTAPKLAVDFHPDFTFHLFSECFFFFFLRLFNPNIPITIKENP